MSIFMPETFIKQSQDDIQYCNTLMHNYYMFSFQLAYLPMGRVMFPWSFYLISLIIILYKIDWYKK